MSENIKIYASQDWVNENTVKSWNQLEDKPFYSEEGSATYLLQDIFLVPDEGDGGTMFLLPEYLISLEEGQTYTVVWNGVDYETACTKIVEDGMTGYCLGDLGMAENGTPTTGEPFIIVFMPPELVAEAGYAGMVVPFDGSTSVVMSVLTTASEQVYKLDNKYLGLDWLPVIINEKELLAKRTIDSAKSSNLNYIPEVTQDMIADGQTVIVDYDDVLYECKAAEFPDFGTIIGDTNALTGSFGKMPFVISLYGNGMSIHCEVEGEHTLGLYIPNEGYRYNKLPDGYLTFKTSLLEGLTSNIQEQLDSKPGKVVNKFDQFVIDGQTYTARGSGETFNNKDISPNYAIGVSSHAEGSFTKAFGSDSHAEGSSTTASGASSHSEGGSTTAGGVYSHAEGCATSARGVYSHAEGDHTITGSESQHVQGKHNIIDENGVYAHIVGNGDYGKSSNAHTLDWDGNAWFAGDVYVGSTSGTNKDEGSKKLATEEYVLENADASGAASSAVSVHNTKTDAHNDIRLLINTLTTRLDALANSDDDTLDQMAEVVAYIKDNRELLEQVTTGKVSVSDIINNLTTNVANKPLSAAQGVALKALIDAIEVPTKVSELTNDKNYLTSIPSEYVTETELNAKGYLTQHQDISGKLDASKLPEAINTALSQAKASGDFDGADGQRGTGLLPVTTAPSDYTTAVGGITPKYRMAISTIKTQSGATEVLLGDTIRYSYYHYPIAYLDSSYAYCTTRTSIRGATGAAYTLTDEDKATIVEAVASSLTTETWTFTLKDGSTVTKKVVLG